jgi:hypothetical protein
MGHFARECNSGRPGTPNLTKIITEEDIGEEADLVLQTLIATRRAREGIAVTAAIEEEAVNQR